MDENICVTAALTILRKLLKITASYEKSLHNFGTAIVRCSSQANCIPGKAANFFQPLQYRPADACLQQPHPAFNRHVCVGYTGLTPLPKTVMTRCNKAFYIVQ